MSLRARIDLKRMHVVPWMMGLMVMGLVASAGAQTFSNPTLIKIPATGTGPGPASPYPSDIVVSGLTQPVGDVTINVFGLSHTFPADIGMLLVGPDGQTVLLMADVGGNCNIVNVNLTFADGAPPLPTDCIASGTYAPTNYGSTDMFPPPAPLGPNETALSAFVGRNANGT